MTEEGPKTEQEGGRVFFSNANRHIVDEDEIELTSVGVDIGSSTSHLVFSRLELEQRDSRYVVKNREVLYESDILLTPYRDENTIDSDKLGRFIAEQYEAVGIDPSQIDTGALILTGVAVRRQNARAIGELFAKEAGKFVSVSAGDNLETTMAAYGSGAVGNSEAVGATVMNVDIGGGTSKIAVCSNGKVADLTAIDVGARLVAFNRDGLVTRIEEAGRRFAKEAGVDLALGKPLSQDAMKAMADRMAARLMEVISLKPLSADTEALLRLPAMQFQGKVDAITFSGGVSEFVYGYETSNFGDLGPYLAAAIRAHVDASGLKLMEPVEGIRATVIGASQYTIQVSGSTIFVSPADTLPLRNIPVIAPNFALDPDADQLDAKVIARETESALRRLDLDHGDTAVAVCFNWQGSATFQRLHAFASGVAEGLKSVLGKVHPLVLVSDGDIGGLLGIHVREELKLDNAVVSIDGVELKEFDFIDIGALLPSSGAVPVVIKSLVFPKTAALGREGVESAKARA
ncbi:MAG TPA: ethanolamine ammonia-lyase reactivating factor EutA [Alphaproteobacteria bacterium]|nr:ethanolamine ammonia-lyase reactivating factor EutA [Alphaproteobacteria bacterium]